jgi:hypothetical protein
VIKIDLDDLSSGSGGSDEEGSSSSSSSSSGDEVLGKETGTVLNFSQVDSEIAKIRVGPESVTDSRSKHLKISTTMKSEVSTGARITQKAVQASKSTISLAPSKRPTTTKTNSKPAMTPFHQKGPDQPPVSVDKLRQQYKRNQIQYNLLLDKYEKQSKKCLEMQDDLRQMQCEEFKNRFKIQLDLLDKKYQESTLKVETLKQQIRDTNKELYKYKQQSQNQAGIITTLEEKHKVMVETLQEDSKIK